MATPLDKIEDGHEFQRIVAEYFRCLKEERHDYHIMDIDVEDYGIGGDDGCDILVEFHFEDAIKKHTHKWVIECKSQKRAVSPDDIDTKNIGTILKTNNADGYLLICKSDATAKLKRWFKSLNNDINEADYMIWNGSQLWRKFSSRESILKAFFNEYYQEMFIESKLKEKFDSYVNEFERKLIK